MARGSWKQPEKVVPRSQHEKKLAKRLARIYYDHVIAKEINARPWRKDVPIEDLARIFPHFVKTARLVLELKAKPETFITAQFEEFWPRNKYPYPPQLHSDNAGNRYAQYMTARKVNLRGLNNRMTRKLNGQEFMHEEMRLKSLTATRSMDESQVLREFCYRFSREFLKRKRVWGKCKAKWEAYKKTAVLSE